MDTTPLLVKETDDTLFSASWLVEDAFLCVSRPQPVPTARAHRMYVVHSELAFIGRFILYVVIGLAFVQTPSWCDESKPFPCGNPADLSTPMTFQMNFLSKSQSRWIEATCLLLLLVNVLVPYAYLHERFLVRLESRIELVLLVVSLVDLSFSAVFPTLYAPIARLCLHGYVRIALLVTTHTTLRRSLRKILLVLSEIYSILSLVFVFILFYSWMSIVLFSGTIEGDTQMPNMVEATWHFYILLTTSNFPDIMMPAYNANRASCLFFMLFICFGLFFLMNIVLAVIFNNFARYTEAESKLRHAIRKNKLTQAFHLLARSRAPRAAAAAGIPLDVCVRMFDELNRCNHVSHIQKAKMHQVFAALDTNGDNEIQLGEFLETCDVLETLLFADDVFRSEVDVWCPAIAHAPWFLAFGNAIRSQYFEWVIDAALVLNAVLVVVESSGVIYGDASADNHWVGWDRFEVAFTTLYVFEMTAKVVLDGTRRYWASVKNRFDCIITVAVVGVDLVTYTGSASPSPQLVRVFLIARCLRLFRLIINIRGYRLIFTTWFRLLQFGMHLLLLLFCHMYMFALLGNQLFGGRISPAVMRTSFPNDPYTQSDYMANNFNDMPGAIVTLFELILVNNWVVIAGGHVAVTSTYARWFFIAYHVLGVTFLLNLVVASILDAFLDEYKTEHAKNVAEAALDDDNSASAIPFLDQTIALDRGRDQASSLKHRPSYGTPQTTASS